MQSPLNQAAIPLVFTRPLAIVGGGTVDQALLRELAARGVALVGADGGGDTIGAAGLVPEAIIGDLDSLRDREGWEQRTRVIELSEQVTTDFQKALYSTQAPVTLALGMTGKRLDHTLAALSALLQVGAERHVLLVDEVDVALAVSGPFAFEAQAGERVSVHPLLPVRFERSAGLAYPLDGLVLDPAGRLGTSNAATGGLVEIVPADGTVWLLILGRERLWDLVLQCLSRQEAPPP
ncbi:thiamine diphosphokinase [Devosia rhizoryzae]|uniref:Thiamine diphosphokinase n=1 Tax=Devosia rhizoryzae TaxID=2774137 RepID=A0ABX7C738_9HYPH|nr:thiamine diphosphokinase [Devosia rhizoryzae]QQR39598.1 thiamine diphosphokinase [Devosia rhizoryzae]